MDDYDLFYRESVISAGRGGGLYVQIEDDNLKLNSIVTNHDDTDFYRCFKTRLDYSRCTNILINNDGASIVVVGRS